MHGFGPCRCNGRESTKQAVVPRFRIPGLQSIPERLIYETVVKYAGKKTKKSTPEIKQMPMPLKIVVIRC